MPPPKIEPVYSIQETLCMLIILFLVIMSIIEIRLWSKILVSIMSLIIAYLHYYVLYLVSQYETIVFLPFTTIETAGNGYSALSIDYGQILIVTTMLLWRKELVNLIRKIYSRIKTKR